MSTIPDSNQFNVNLKAFNGPLDVLLDLAKSQKVNLENINKKSLDFVKSNGIEDDLLSFAGLNPQLLEVLVKDGIKSLKDFATCADWELAGGYTTVDGKRVRDEGLLENFDLICCKLKNRPKGFQNKFLLVFLQCWLHLMKFLSLHKN